MLAVTTKQCRMVCVSNMVPMSLSRDANEKVVQAKYKGEGYVTIILFVREEQDATTMAIPTNASVCQRTVTDVRAQRYKQVKVQSYLGIKSCACFISRYLNYNL